MIRQGFCPRGPSLSTGSALIRCRTVSSPQALESFCNWKTVLPLGEMETLPSFLTINSFPKTLMKVIGKFFVICQLYECKAPYLGAICCYFGDSSILWMFSLCVKNLPPSSLHYFPKDAGKSLSKSLFAVQGSDLGFANQMLSHETRVVGWEARSTKEQA